MCSLDSSGLNRGCPFVDVDVCTQLLCMKTDFDDVPDTQAFRVSE